MKKVLLVLSLVCLFSCNNVASSSEKITSESLTSVIETTSSEESSISVEKKEEKVLEVDLTNDKEAIDLSTNETEKKRIKSLFGELLTDFKSEKAFSSDGGIKLASSKYDGYIELSFTNIISKIEVEAKSYTNYVEYTQTYYCDKPAFLINDIDVNIDHYENASSEYKLYSVDVSELSSNSIKLESKNGRTILKALKIYYFIN